MLRRCRGWLRSERRSHASVLFDMPVMRWSDADDGALLAASRSEPGAFMTFYRRYESAVIGYLLRRTGNTELAVDLASEVFAEALASRGRYRRGTDSAAAWSFTIAHHILTDSLRRGRVDARAWRRIGIVDAIAYSDGDLERIESLVRLARSDSRVDVALVWRGPPATSRSRRKPRDLCDRNGGLSTSSRNTPVSMSTVERLVTVIDIDDRDPGARSIRARHEAALADGRRFVLLDDRGWSSSAGVDGRPTPCSAGVADLGPPCSFLLWPRSAIRMRRWGIASPVQPPR